MTVTRASAPPTAEPAGTAGAVKQRGGTTWAKRNRSLARRSLRAFGNCALTLVPLVLVLLAWQFLAANHVVAWLRFDKIPTPGAVWHRWLEELHTSSYYKDIISSMRRILFGFLIAAAVGVATGITIGRSRWAARLIRPVLEVTRPIPAIALVPLVILLFPSSEQGIVFITFFAAFFPVVVSTLHTTRGLPKVWEEAARTMGASKLSVLLNVILPGATPGIFSGLSVSMGVAWICVISAEMISGQFGIGYFTWEAYGLLDYAGVVVGMLTIGVLGLATAWLVERVGRKLTAWLPAVDR